MNKITQRIKVLLGMVKEKFATAKLEDGKSISFEALEINREVYDEEGNSLKEGEYTLEDGTKLIVDENGVIKEIVNSETGEETKEEVVEEKAAEEKPVEEKVEETVSEEVKTEEPKSEDLTPRIEALEKSVDEIYEMVLAISHKLKSNEEKVEETVEEFKKIKQEPTAQPIHFGKEYTNEESMSASERFLSFKHNNK